MSEESKAVLYQIDGAIARVTLNRPEKRNALNEELIAGLTEALRQASDETAKRVAVISGAGSDFCSGADLASLQKICRGSVAENTADARSLMELFCANPASQPTSSSGRTREGTRRRVWACECMRHRTRVSKRPVWLSGSEDRLRSRDGDGDSAAKCLGEAGV